MITRGETFVCTFQLKDANHWLPRTFVWNDRDRDALMSYIDALTEKNKTVAAMWETKGVPTEHVYVAAPECIIRLDPAKLMAVLRGEYALEVPAYGRIMLTSEGQQLVYMPQAVEASLLAADGPLAELYLKRIRQMVGAGEPVVCMTRKEFDSPSVKAIGLTLWNPKGNLTGDIKPPKRIPFFTQDLTEQAPESAPVQRNEAEEIEINRVEHSTHLEINYTKGDYFVRRLFLDEMEFYVASSYDGQQWDVFSVDQAIYDTVFNHELASS